MSGWGSDGDPAYADTTAAPPRDGDVYTMGDAEEEGDRIVRRLDDLSDEYRRDTERAAESEADYRLAYWTTFLQIRANGVRKPDGTVGKATDKEAEGYATTAAERELRAYKITAAKAEATKQALYTHRARLDYVRTKSANARAAST